MTVRIRPARLQDAHALPAIERSAGSLFRTIPDLGWIADDDVMSLEDHRNFIAHACAWVASDNNRLVGFLAAEQMSETLHIWELAVHAEHQGRGAGRALMAHAVAHARAQACAAVTLTTFRDVAWNEAFYARLGFATLDTHAQDVRLAAILAREAENGLPPARRCAMRLALEKPC